MQDARHDRVLSGILKHSTNTLLSCYALMGHSKCQQCLQERHDIVRALCAVAEHYYSLSLFQKQGAQIQGLQICILLQDF